MAYTTGAKIRLIASEFFNSDDFSDAALLAYATNNGNPEIDARLLAGGFTVPASVPSLIESCSSMLAASYAMEDAISQRQITLDDDDQPERLRRRVFEILDAIVDGKSAIATLVRATGEAKFQVDSDPETLHENAAIVGAEEDWKWATEDRED